MLTYSDTTLGWDTSTFVAQRQIFATHMPKWHVLTEVDRAEARSDLMGAPGDGLADPAGLVPPSQSCIVA
jgi:hypothetical protein